MHVFQRTCFAFFSAHYALFMANLTHTKGFHHPFCPLMTQISVFRPLPPTGDWVWVVSTLQTFLISTSSSTWPKSNWICHPHTFKTCLTCDLQVGECNLLHSYPSKKKRNYDLCPLTLTSIYLLLSISWICPQFFPLFSFLTGLLQEQY